MADKTPVKATFTGSDVTGLAEFQTADTIGVADGGTGLNAVGSAGQILKVNSGGTALEYVNVEAIVNIDGATDLTSATLATTDLLLASDGGTEGRITLAQIDTLFSGTTKTLTNKTLDGATNTLSGTFSGITSLTSSTLSDGTLSISSGSITSAVNGTFSGTVNASTDVQVGGISVSTKPFAIAQAVALG